MIKDIHFINVAKKNKIPRIDCFFNDKDSAKTTKVKAAISNKSLHYESFGDIHFSSRDYKDYLIGLNKKLFELKNSKAFVFIDPYEYKHVKISHIQELMANSNTEVLLWLPTQFMYRFETNGTPTALKDFIEELVPYDKWDSSNSIWVFVEQLKQGFQNAMGSGFFVDHFTLQKDKNAVFCLFFFTSHIRGFEKMLESKWKIDTEQGKGWNYNSGQQSLFSDQKTNVLEENLIFFMDKTPRVNGEVYEFTLRQGFLPKHTNEILYNWQQSKRIDVLLTDGTKARNKAFYISYSNYKKSYSKVSFKIKS
ncbi:MAG TPA: three-Cys-motif partner protein TcmP [Pricia sp.]|nr:three-Cys-motif partner protein TcmP [Pricia sp.]